MRDQPQKTLTKKEEKWDPQSTIHNETQQSRGQWITVLITIKRMVIKAIKTKSISTNLIKKYYMSDMKDVFFLC